MNNNQRKALSRKLDSYMRFRATREGVPYGLNARFFLDNLKLGVRSFFGVVCNAGAIVRDVQQPEMFNDWKNSAAAEIAI
jgi:hypothetical protein